MRDAPRLLGCQIEFCKSVHSQDGESAAFGQRNESFGFLRETEQAVAQGMIRTRRQVPKLAVVEWGRGPLLELTAYLASFGYHSSQAGSYHDQVTFAAKREDS